MNGGCVAADGPARDTITDQMLAKVFQVKIAVGRTPPAGVPFVLPQAMQNCLDHSWTVRDVPTGAPTISS
jgi:hypothetical protein